MPIPVSAPGTQVSVATSRCSPGGHAATAGTDPVDGVANTANAGAAAIASANPPATASRRTGLLIVAMLISCQFAVLLYARSLCKRSPPRRCYKDRPDLDIR
ncbi:MAG: hypothetical protein KDB49_22970, partial [Mycobacterium sp.]|nr:hypothetical protein [Mycobacterium sp.]